MHISSKDSKGFSLVELMVVISIIAVLSSVVSLAVHTAKLKSEDTQTIRETLELQKALDTYYADHGVYPYVGMSDPGSWGLHSITNYPMNSGGDLAQIAINNAQNLSALEANLQNYIPSLPKSLTGANGTKESMSLVIADRNFTGNNGSGWLGPIRSASDGAFYCYWSMADGYIIFTRLSTPNVNPIANPEGFHSWNLFVTGGNSFSGHYGTISPYGDGEPCQSE